MARCQRHLLVFTGICALSLMMAGCASTPPPAPTKSPAPIPRPHSTGKMLSDDQQCVPFARNHSAVKLFGDAYLWWGRAKGRYVRRDTPSIGAIMVLDHYAGPKHAHLAVIRAIDNAHQIRVDHANWLNGGDIHLNDAVRDVSRAQNWSQVRIFDLATRQWGRHAYHVRGFIGPEQIGVPNKSAPPKSISDLISSAAPPPHPGAF